MEKQNYTVQNTNIYVNKNGLIFYILIIKDNCQLRWWSEVIINITQIILDIEPKHHNNLTVAAEPGLTVKLLTALTH